MPAAKAEYETIMDLSAEIEQLSDQENPYTSLTKQVRLSHNCKVIQ